MRGGPAPGRPGPRPPLGAAGRDGEQPRRQSEREGDGPSKRERVRVRVHVRVRVRVRVHVRVRVQEMIVWVRHADPRPLVRHRAETELVSNETLIG